MATRPKQLCAVTVGFDTYILPMADGLRLVEIMSKAVPAHRQYGVGGPKFSVNADPDPSRAGLELVRPDEIEVLPGTSPKHLRQLALPGRRTS